MLESAALFNPSIVPASEPDRSQSRGSSLHPDPSSNRRGPYFIARVSQWSHPKESLHRDGRDVASCNRPRHRSRSHLSEEYLSSQAARKRPGEQLVVSVMNKLGVTFTRTELDESMQ